MTRRAVPLHLFTDSKHLFEIIRKCSRTNEKSMVLDVLATRQAYKARQISNLSFVRSEDNLADGLTEKMKQAALLNLIRTGIHRVH